MTPTIDPGAPVQRDRRDMMFSRIPVAQMNRGRVNQGSGEPAPPPVDDILTIGGDALQDGGVDLKNG